MSSKPTKKFHLGGVKIREATATEKDQVVQKQEEQNDLLKSPTVAPEPAPKPKAKPLEPIFKKPTKPAAAPSPPQAVPKPLLLNPMEPVTAAPSRHEEPDISIYDLNLQPYARGILDVESNNPYKPQDTFPVPTRRGFSEQIVQTYDSFIKFDDGKPIDFEACRKMGAAGEQNVQMYLYQEFVREYMRQASPYRGLLVYHGLGSGKTCSAIATAEALFSTTRKRIIIMTPFSLRENFMKEITFCGFRHYRLQNFWVQLDTSSPTAALFAKEILDLPEAYVKKAREIWVPDFSADKAPNFDTLPPADRDAIRRQLYAQIQSRIQFINYNGITSTKLKQMACQPGEKGFFDDAVIVVDEIHNLTRLMQGTIEPYLITLPGVKRKVAPEPVVPGRWKPSLCASTKNYKRGYLLYRMLVSARNAKFIGLSGTPLINFPEELGILMNILHGYIDVGRMTVAPANGETEKKVNALLEGHPFIDFYETKLSITGISILFTILPEGTRKSLDPQGVFKGVQRTDSIRSIQEIGEELKTALVGQGCRISVEPAYTSEPLLHPIGQHFREAFLQTDGSTLRNTVVLRKRIQGLISYYRGSKQELMPTVTRDETVRVPMSKYVQAEYMRVRIEEVKQDIEKSKKKKDQPTVAGFVGHMGAVWAEIYDIASMKNSTSYRMTSRQTCNFAFPEKIMRPRASNQKEVTEETGADVAVLLDADAVLGEEEDGLPVDAEVGENGEAAALAEDAAIEAEEAEDSAAEETAAVPETLVSDVATLAQSQSQIPGKPKTMKQLQEERKAEEDRCKQGMIPGEKYQVALKRAKQCLINFAKKKLMLPSASAVAGQEGSADTLDKYSPKYAAMLTRILASRGSSLVYSQFLDMEGIGIFSIALDANGFVPIEIQNVAGGAGYQFSERTKASLLKGSEQNRYLVFSGGEKREIRILALKLFNAKFTELPESLQTVSYKGSEPVALSTLFPEGNKRGGLCRVFCITSAGAEGLSLKNVRQVHIMEPYWNSVRTDQVKGRAVRICSHTDLEYNEDPEVNERTVEIFTYVSVFPTEAQTAPIEARLIDQTLIASDSISKEDAEATGIPYPAGAKQYVLTSDEHLYYISERKKKLLAAIQDIMKGAAVDCSLNQYENKDDGITCLPLPPGTQGDFAFHPVLVEDILQTGQTFQQPTAPAKAGPKPPLTQRATDAIQQPQKPVEKAKVKARKIQVGPTVYLAIPKQEKAGGKPLSYDIFGEFDTKRIKRLGTMAADLTSGDPSGELILL